MADGEIPYSTDFERYQRMAEQTHPEILPLCVDTLLVERNKHAVLQDLMHEAIDQQYRQTCTAVGQTALAVAGLEVMAYTANSLFHTKLDSPTILILGTAVAVGRAIGHISRALIFEAVHRQFKSNASRMEELYNQANNRAISIGLGKPAVEAILLEE